MSLYPNGMAADNVRRHKLGFFKRLCLRAAIMMTRRATDAFGIRGRRAIVNQKPEGFVPEPHSPTLGAELR